MADYLAGPIPKVGQNTIISSPCTRADVWQDNAKIVRWTWRPFATHVTRTTEPWQQGMAACKAGLVPVLRMGWNDIAEAIQLQGTPICC